MTLSAEDLATLVAIDKKQRAKLTEEQNASNKAKLAELMTDQEKMAEAVATHQELIAAADADGDGKLNLDEWKAYTKASVARGTEKGWHVAEHDDADVEVSWAVYCRAGGDEGGVTAATLMACSGQVMKAA